MQCFLVITIIMALSLASDARPHHEVDHLTDEVVYLPYYGGAKGQTLQIVHNKDGTISSSIIKNYDGSLRDKAMFASKLQSIQEAAAHLVTIQQNAKNKGTLTPEDSQAYAQNLHQLGVAAQELAQLQQSGHVDIQNLFNTQQGNDMQQVVQDVAEKMDFGEISNDHEDDEQSYLDQNVQQDDTVQVSAPKKDSAIAEASPVGLSIAGDGGVASSKPMGTAISGENGLAVAKPVATAIAGLKPSEVANLGVPIPNRVTKAQDDSKYRLTADGYLAGPNVSVQIARDEIFRSQGANTDADSVVVERVSQLRKDTSNIAGETRKGSPYAIVVPGDTSRPSTNDAGTYYLI